MYSLPPLAAAISLLYTVVTSLATMLTPIFASGGAAAAIVVMTVAIRLILTPFGFAQVRAEQHRRRLAPEIRELQKRYRHNRERLHRELTQLYARAGTSPLAGCLPALAQAPVFTVLYGLFVTDEIGGHTNELLNKTLAGVQLGARFTDAVGSSGIVVFAVLFVLLAAVAWTTRRQAVAGPSDMPGAALIRLLPFGTVLIAGVVPLAAGLYLLTTTAWTLGERTMFRRVLPLVG